MMSSALSVDAASVTDAVTAPATVLARAVAACFAENICRKSRRVVEEDSLMRASSGAGYLARRGGRGVPHVGTESPSSRSPPLAGVHLDNRVLSILVEDARDLGEVGGLRQRELQQDASLLGQQVVAGNDVRLATTRRV